LKRSYKVLLLLFVILIMGYAACHPDPMNHRITPKNEKAFHKSVVANEIDKDIFINVFESQIRGVRNLSDEDRFLLIKYIIRHLLDEDEETTYPLVGKTVKEIINLEKDLERKENEEKAKITLLENSITLTVEKKEPITDKKLYDIKMSPFGDIFFDIRCENISKKDIRAFKGKLIFRDIFGDPIRNTDVELIKPIKTGEIVTLKIRTVVLNERLKTLDLNDIKVLWRPEKIVFTDGTIISRE